MTSAAKPKEHFFDFSNLSLDDPAAVRIGPAEPIPASLWSAVLAGLGARGEVRVARVVRVLDDAYILIRDKTISSIQELLPILEKIAQTGRPFVIVAEDVDGEALATG